MVYKITALTLQQRNHQRINVFLDGEFAFGLSRFVAAWLEVGQELTEEKIAQLKAEDGREVAYQRALKFINYRPRTTSEIRQNLKKHGITDEVIANVMARLEQSGWVNDTRFAQDWVDNRTDLRPRSKRALAYELRQRGIERETIEQAVEAVDDESMAYQAALKQSRKYQTLEWQDFRQKMLSFLARRGFSYEVSAEATSKVWNEMQENPSTGLIDHSFKNLSSNEEVDQ